MRTTQRSGAYSDLSIDVRFEKFFVEGRKQPYAVTAWSDQGSFVVSCEDVSIYDEEGKVILGHERMPASFPTAGLHVSIVVEDPVDRFLAYRVLERISCEVLGE